MPNIEKVRAWAKGGETEDAEFKTSTGQRTEACKGLCAMLNKNGGRVLFGVDPKGRVLGQNVADSTLTDVSNEIGQIDPPVFPTISKIPLVDDKYVIAVEVPRGHLRPYTFRGRAYKRVGNANIEMGHEELAKAYLEQWHARARWESEVADGWTLSDLDGQEVVSTIEEAIRRGRQMDPGTRNNGDILKGLGLLRDGALTRAAVVLFGREDRLLPDFTQCCLRLARFRGIDKTEFIDNRQYHGNAFQLLRRADQFLKDHLPVAGRVVPNVIERQDEPLYPPIALREALANAFCHRDYAIGGGSVAIGIFANRLEITSSGSLHFGLTVEDLFKPHESLPWNPLIAATFYRRGIIERWGRGTLAMAEATEKAGLPRPKIEELPGAIAVTFLPSQKMTSLNDRQRAILKILASHERLALRELAAEIGGRIPLRTIREDLRSLRTLRLVESVGHGRGAFWLIQKNS